MNLRIYHLISQVQAEIAKNLRIYRLIPQVNEKISTNLRIYHGISQVQAEISMNLRIYRLISQVQAKIVSNLRIYRLIPQVQAKIVSNLRICPPPKPTTILYSVTSVTGAPPRNTALTFFKHRFSIASRVSTEAEPICGSSTTLSKRTNG